MSRAFVIHQTDNVATALEELSPGEVRLAGDSPAASLIAAGPVQLGHKLALVGIQPGEPIRKFGTVIGEATRTIQAGEWVHLHNMKSRFDERSNTLNADSGAPTEEGVYV